MQKIILLFIMLVQLAFSDSYRVVEINTDLNNTPFAYEEKENIKGIYTDIINSAIKKVGVYTVKFLHDNQNDCLNKLYKDEILAYLIDDNNLTLEAKENLKNFYSLHIQYTTQIKQKEYKLDLALYFSKKTFIFKEDFSKSFNLAIDIMKNNGEIDAIIKNYLDDLGVKVVPIVLYEWGGYMSSPKLDQYGMFAEIISAIWKEAGYSVEFQFVSPHYGDLLARWGEVLAQAPSHENASKYKFFYYSNPIFTLPTDLFYKRDNFPNGIKSDLEKYKIGAIKKYFYQDDLENTKLNIVYFDTEKELYTAFLLNNIDLLVSSRNLFIEEMLKYDPLIYKFALYEGEFLKPQDITLAFSKYYYNSEYLVELFNKSFEIVKKDGTINDILKKYGFVK